MSFCFSTYASTMGMTQDFLLKDYPPESIFILSLTRIRGYY